MPKVGGGTEVVWRNAEEDERDSGCIGSDVEISIKDLKIGSSDPANADGADNASVKGAAPRRFSPLLLGLVRERERAHAEGNSARASELQQQMLNDHGLAVDPANGSWTSRGGWRGEFGQEPVYDGPPPRARRRRRRSKHKPKPCTKEPPRNRHKLFASFIVDTFGRDVLNSGCGVLDVAGGKGFVAAELQDVRGVQCTVVETNPLHGAARIHGSENGGEVVWRELNVKIWEGPFEPVAADAINAGEAPGCDHDNGDADSDDDDHDNDDDHDHDDDDGHDDDDDRRHGNANEGLDGDRGAGPQQPDREDSRGSSTQGRRGLDDEQHGTAALQEMCGSCSCLVGMHPDETTDAIVDTALALGKPFAIVPCCVFASTFPDRRLPDGRPVTYFEELLQYLKAKHPGIRQSRLNYYGRSEVLYWDPRCSCNEEQQPLEAAATAAAAAAQG